MSYQINAKDIKLLRRNHPGVASLLEFLLSEVGTINNRVDDLVKANHLKEPKEEKDDRTESKE